MFKYHNKLNPLLWEDDKLKTNVKMKLIDIYQLFMSKLKENKIPIDVIDVLLLGSNASYNYTDNSDIDLHIVVDFNEIPLDKNVTQIFYNNEKSKFNDDYNITIKGLPVEIYIEDINAGTLSNGIYSLLQDKWIKFPEYNPPKDIDYSKLLDYYNNKIFNTLLSDSSEEVKNMINEIKMLRKISLIDDGEYSKGNLVFKELRNNGTIDKLYDKLHELTSQELSLENKQLNESTDISLVDKLNSLPKAYPNTAKSKPFADYELIVEYEKILKQFSIGTTLTHKIDAGTEKFIKTSDGWWDHFRAPWKNINKRTSFSVGKWLANRGNISRGKIELTK